MAMPDDIAPAPRLTIIHPPAEPARRPVVLATEPTAF